MRYLRNDKLYCFSPPVMLATFLIEIGLALYVVWRYGLNNVTRITAAILVALSVFQLAEFNVCEGAWGLDSVGWARIGYVAITLLPPLGIHLISQLSGDKRRWPTRGAYLLGGMFSAYFLFSTSGITSGACMGNYVIFEQANGTAQIYGLYYYGLLLAAIGYALNLAKVAKPAVKKSLRTLVIGYALFMVPTTVVNLIDPSTLAGIPSIMCGFAVILAIVLAFAVMPFAHEGTVLQKSEQRKKPDVISA